MLKNSEIKKITIKLIVQNMKSFFSHENKRKFHPLDLIMPKERFIRNKIGGLETSMGEHLWEPLARGLAKENDFKVHNHLDILEPESCPENIRTTVESIIRDRKDNKGDYDYITSHEAIKNTCKYFINNPVKEWVKPTSGHGVDIWIEKEGKHYLYDTKTVQPNAGSVLGYIEQLHRWYFFFYAKNPTSNLNAAIVFPYNPYKEPLFSGKRFFPLATKHEALDGETFWSFLTDNKMAMSIILKAFNEVNKKGLVGKAIDKGMKITKI